MKRISFLALTLFSLLLLFGCGQPAVNSDKINGEAWINLDESTQTAVVEQLMKNVNNKGIDHTSSYFVRQLNSYFGDTSKAKEPIKEVFIQLATTNKTAEQLVVVDGYGWEKLTSEQKLAMINSEIKDITDKNPAFKPKAAVEYLRKIEEVYKSKDERILKLAVSDTIKKVLTNNLIIDDVLVK